MGGMHSGAIAAQVAAFITGMLFLGLHAKRKLDELDKDPNRHIRRYSIENAGNNDAKTLNGGGHDELHGQKSGLGGGSSASEAPERRASAGAIALSQDAVSEEARLILRDWPQHTLESRPGGVTDAAHAAFERLDDLALAHDSVAPLVLDAVRALLGGDDPVMRKRKHPTPDGMVKLSCWMSVLRSAEFPEGFLEALPSGDGFLAVLNKGEEHDAFVHLFFPYELDFFEAVLAAIDPRPAAKAKGKNKKNS